MTVVYETRTVTPPELPARRSVPPNELCCDHVEERGRHLIWCMRGRERWRIRFDFHALAPETPWTVWRFNDALGKHGAWAVCATFLDALIVVDSLTRKYADLPVTESV